MMLLIGILSWLNQEFGLCNRSAVLAKQCPSLRNSSTAALANCRAVASWVISCSNQCWAISEKPSDNMFFLTCYNIMIQYIACWLHQISNSFIIIIPSFCCAWWDGDDVHGQTYACCWCCTLARLFLSADMARCLHRFWLLVTITFKSKYCHTGDIH